jgi:hypothetical protein
MQQAQLKQGHGNQCQTPGIKGENGMKLKETEKQEEKKHQKLKENG